MSAKIKDEIWEDIIGYIEKGLVPAQAYLCAGVSKDCYYRKLKDDKDYYDTIKTAQQKFKQHHVNNIMRHSEKDWHASGWLLERIYSKEYAKIEKVEEKKVDEFSNMDDNDIDNELSKFNEGSEDKNTETPERETET